MLCGIMANGTVVLDDSGKPIRDVEAPEAPEGYEAEPSWVDTGSEIVRSWALVPMEGTKGDAVLTLAAMLADSLSDEEALKVPALYDEWRPGVTYKKDKRLLRLGKLYRVIKDHLSQSGWEPENAASLYAPVLPGQSGEVGEWVQPDSTNGYSIGDQVIWDGHKWESIVNDNVDEPGTDNGFRWKDLGEYPVQTRAAGAHFAE